MCGFRVSYGRLICKDFCLIESNGKIYHKFVKSPILPKKSKIKYFYEVKINYQEKFGHKIPYDYGNINVTELITDVYDKLDPQKKIVVCDTSDRHNLKYIFRNYCKFDNDRFITQTYDLHYYRETADKTILKLLPFCDYHNSMFGWGSGPCAKNNALRLRYIFAESEKQKNEC